MIYTILNDELTVSISDMGAEVVSVIHKGRQRVWQNDNGTWFGHSPVLFPVCGNNAVVIDGKDYNMPFHGFARKSVFSVVKNMSDSITLLLDYNEETMKVYPFKFRLSITYSVKDNALLIDNTIKNLGDCTMPFALGRHDSFLLDEPISNYKLCFDKSEEFLSQKTDRDRNLTNLYYDFGGGEEFSLPEEYLINGQAIIFGEINSRKISLKTSDNRLIAVLSSDCTDNLLLWRPADSQMICIELWSALPDNAYETVEFDSNEKYCSLNINEEKTMEFKIEY